MTVFDMPRAARERPGNNSMSPLTSRVNGQAALESWAARLASHGIPIGEIALGDARQVLDLADPLGNAALSRRRLW